MVLIARQLLARLCSWPRGFDWRFKCAVRPVDSLARSSSTFAFPFRILNSTFEMSQFERSHPGNFLLTWSQRFCWM